MEVQAIWFQLEKLTLVDQPSALPFPAQMNWSESIVRLRRQVNRRAQQRGPACYDQTLRIGRSLRFSWPCANL